MRQAKTLPLANPPAVPPFPTTCAPSSTVLVSAALIGPVNDPDITLFIDVIPLCPYV